MDVCSEKMVIGRDPDKIEAYFGGVPAGRGSRMGHAERIPEGAVFLTDDEVEKMALREVRNWKPKWEM